MKLALVLSEPQRLRAGNGARFSGLDLALKMGGSRWDFPEVARPLCD